jgi:hypothetical protein
VPFPTTEAPPAASVRGLHPVIKATFVLVALAYLAQCASPLRLINDGVDYLMQASSALDGHGFLLHGTRSMRPPGYPALIFVLARLGLGTSWAIVALNCLMLGIACYASYFVLRRSFDFSRERSRVICLLTLFSYLMVRNVGYPLSDISYFGLSVPCLLLLLKAESEPGSFRWRLLVAIPLMFVCIEVRTIGIVLIPAFLWAAIGGMQGAKRIYPAMRRLRLPLSLLAIALIAVVSVLFFHSRYLQFNLPIFLHRGIVRSITANLGYHTAEWGEMMLNAPLSKIPQFLAIPLRVTGAIALFACVFGIWTKRDRTDSVLLYVIGGACIVLAYPWFDTRLWLPFVPFLMAYTLVGFERILPARMLRPLLLAYCSSFVLLGVIALGFSTRLTFSGSRFPDLYGDGNFRATYKLALFGEQPAIGANVDRDALYLLRRFEPRAEK